MEQLLSLFFLFQVLVYATFLCFNILLVTSLPVASSEFGTQLIFITCILSLLLIPSWYGNELTVQSLEVAKAAYHSGWYEAPKDFNTCLCIVIMRSQKPLTLTAWKFFIVNLHMFTMVLKTAYSCYQVLHKVYSD